MRIVIDLQGAQSIPSGQRGIGRYSTAITKAIIRHRGSHEIIVVLSTLLPGSIDEIRSEIGEVLPEENIKVWCSPGDTEYSDISNRWRRSVAEYTREAFLYSLKPDLIYVTSLFEGLTDNCITTVGLYRSGIPVAITLYDLIPLLNRERYLGDKQYREWYLGKIDYLKRADLLLSISQSSRGEALEYLDSSPDDVVSIGTASEEQFTQVEVSEVQEKEVRSRYGISRPFLMDVGANDPRKNQEGVIRAYALLDKSLRKSHQLVIVCWVTPKYRSNLEALATKVGLEENELIITGYVSEEDLIMLYNLCRAFIFPSLHEGFGLPALEAMRCGAPVIAADNSSLPEVLGLKEALFDALNDQNMAEKIRSVLTDEVFRKKLIEHNKIQIQKFSWDISAKKAIGAFEKLEKTYQAETRRLKLACFLPFIPEYSDSSNDYVVLLSELQRYYDIDIIVDCEDSLDSRLSTHYAARQLKWFRENASSYNRILYQFGNSQHHRYMYKLIQEYPGVVALHHFSFSKWLYEMDKEGYQDISFDEELYYSHGVIEARDTADTLTRYPVNRRILDCAKGIIAFSEDLKRFAVKWYGRESTASWTLILDEKPTETTTGKNIVGSYGEQYANAIESYYIYRKDDKDCIIEQLKADDMQFRSDVARDFVQRKEKGKTVLQKTRDEFEKTLKKTREEGAAALSQIKQQQALVENKYNEIIHSRSCKITAPLRIFLKHTQWFTQRVWTWLTFASGSRPWRAWERLKNSQRVHHLVIQKKKAFASIANTILSFSRLLGLHPKQKWRIEGPFDSSYSLALINREIALALDSLGCNVALHSTEGYGDFQPDTSFLEKNPSVARLNEKSLELSQDEVDVTSRNLYPPRVADMHSPMNLLHNYAWEETAFPQEWVKDFNNSLQGMVLTSQYVKKIMIDNGVSVPLFVSGNGIDHWERIAVDKTYHIKTKSFSFLHVSSCFPRKGADVLLEAYGEAFSSEDDVTLVIKTFPNPHNEIHRWLKEAREIQANYPDVVIIEDDLTQQQLKALYLQCQALVGPSRAEGFGLPFAEAMLSGLPVIATGWSGQLDFCNEDTAWLIDYDFTPAKTHFELFDSVWAEPSQKHLTELMRNVYELPSELRSARAKKGRELLLGEYKWTDVAERLIDASKRISKSDQECSPKIGWLTTWNVRCGIASYSKHLIGAMEHDIVILAPYADDLIARDGPNVYRCWDMQEESMEELSRTVERLGLDTLVIQFNYDFFDFDRLNDFIVDQKEQGHTVVMILHSTADTPKKQLRSMTPGLSVAARVLVHSYHDLNRLKACGLVNNTTLFPHGIQTQKVKSKEKNTTFTLASYGFFLPHKGLPELIDAVKLLLDKGLDIKLKMVNAEYPVRWAADFAKNSSKRVETLGLEQNIEVILDYLPDEVCLEHLNAADLVIFPYQETGESSSAAVRYGLSSGSLVAVTPLEIFDDVEQAVFKLSGCTPQEIAEGIETIMLETMNDTERVQRKRSDAQRWCEAHKFSVLGERLGSMLTALHRR